MRLLITGTGDQAMVAARTATLTGTVVCGFLGRVQGRVATKNYVAGDADDPEAVAKAAASLGADTVHAAFGDNGFRAAAIDAIQTAGLPLAGVTHPEAFIDATAEVSEGCFVGPRAVIGPWAKLSPGSFVNTGAIVEHDCRLGYASAVFSGAVLGGTVELKPLAMVGLGASVLPGVVIGRAAIVGAGASVTDDVPEMSIMAGVPAKVRRARTEDESFL